MDLLSYIKQYNKYSSLFICVSDAVRFHWGKKGIDSHKTVTIYDGIDYEKVPISQDVDKKCPMLKLLMSGGIMPSKGQYLAIKAIGLLPNDVKRNITIDLIGWGSERYLEELKRLSEKVGLVNPVQFLGARDDILSLLSNYHIGLMCSRSEGFGLVTAEFMFAKLGIIASNSGASPELIENGISGLTFQCENFQSLADRILLYYNNRNLIVKHSCKARERALSLFTSQLNAKKIYNRYCSIIDTTTL